MREVGAQVQITQTASGQLVEMAPAAVELILNTLDRLMQTRQPTSSSSDVNFANMTPSERQAKMAVDFNTALSDPHLSPEARWVVENLLQPFYEAAENAERKKYDDGASSEGGGTQVQFIIPPAPAPTGAPPLIGGGTGQDAGTSGGYDPVSETYESGSSPYELPAIEVQRLPLSVQIIYHAVATGIAMAQGKKTQEGSGSNNDGNQTDTYGTPPGAEPPPDGKEDQEPQRVTNPKHHQNSNSPEPKDVDALYNNSVADKSGVRWAKDIDGAIHRFSRPSNDETHWNGSTSDTSPIKPENTPIEIRRLFGLNG